MNSRSGLRVFLSVVLIVGFFVSFTGCSSNVAKVGSKNFSKKEFKALIKATNRENLPEGQLKSYMEEIAQDELLAQEAERKDLDEDPGIRVLVDNYRRQLLSRAIKDKVLEEQLTEDYTKKYYSDHPQEFSDKKISVAHILIRLPRNLDERGRIEAKGRANKVYQLLREGKDFNKLAAEYSDDLATKSNGGYLGWVGKGQLPEELLEAAFKLKQGEFSQPLETRFGYHVLKNLEGPKEITKDFEAMKGTLRYQLGQEVQKSLSEKLRKKRGVKIYDEAIKALVAERSKPVEKAAKQ